MPDENQINSLLVYHRDKSISQYNPLKMGPNHPKIESEKRESSFTNSLPAQKKW